MCLSLLLLAACGSPSHEAIADPKDSGALFGAFVSSTYTDPARISAVETFEGTLGRQVDIVHTYHKWADPFPTMIDRWVADRGDILLLSWAGTKPSEIVDGRYDSMIRKRAEALKKLDTPILLRWRWEMNRPNLRTEIPSPSGYVEAWKHIRAIFADVGPDNVDWVWCPSANGFEETNGAEYYPGDDQVEWLCADAYTPYPNEPLEEVLAPFLDWAKSHADKPIVIGEFGTRQGKLGARAAWFDDAMSYFRRSEQVKAVVAYESATAAAGRYDIAQEPSALEVLRKWSRTSWLNPDWSPAS